MPQASDVLRSLMEQWFGDPADETGPIDFLQSRGYVLQSDYSWKRPVSCHTISAEEAVCVRFLIDEHGMDGIEERPDSYHDALEIEYEFEEDEEADG